MSAGLANGRRNIFDGRSLDDRCTVLYLSGAPVRYALAHDVRSRQYRSWQSPAERLKYASGLFNMMRNLGGAVGIAACGAILSLRTNFRFDAIASNLTPANG
jgi:hypothetical protein